MTNSIKDIQIWHDALSPTEAEVEIGVQPEHVFSMTQVRGKLVGPKCRYASTVEVAYAFRESSREYASTGIPRIVCRALIPEPSLWDPISPFMYKGQVELWESGKQCQIVPITHCLRALSLGRSGLRINGAALNLRGKTVIGPLSETDAVSLHNQGINTLLVEVGNSTPILWDMADRLGFVVLTRVSNEQELKIAASAREKEVEMRNRAFCLGWLISLPAVEREIALMVARNLVNAFSTVLLGLELTQMPSGPLPSGFLFIACEESLAPSLAEIKMPMLLLANQETPSTQIAKTSSPVGILLGYVN